MKLQFDNNELIDVTRSPYNSDARLVVYITPGQISTDSLIAEAKAAENIYFYVNDEVLATYRGYTRFDSATINNIEIIITLVNPNPERKDSYSDYVEAVKILLGDEDIAPDENVVEEAL